MTLPPQSAVAPVLLVVDDLVGTRFAPPQGVRSLVLVVLVGCAHPTTVATPVAAACPDEAWVPVGRETDAAIAERGISIADARDDLAIARVEVRGVEPALAATLASGLRTRAGDRFAAAPIRADLAMLAGIGVLASAEVELDPATRTLAFVVAPAPIVAHVYGVAPTAEHLTRLHYLTGSPYDPLRVQRMVSAVQRAYVRDGHLDARITVATAPATHDLCVRAVPGPRVTLDGVRFPGAHHVPEAALVAKLRQTRANTNHVGGVYAPDLLDDDRSKLTADEFWEHGMALATLGEPRLERHGSQHATLVIPVDEGPVFTVAAIAVPPLLPPPPGVERGDVFARSHVQAAQGALQEFVGERGTLRLETAVHRDVAQIDLTFAVEWRSPWDAIAFYLSH